LLSLIAAGDTHLVVDLSGVDAMDSTGVGALISGVKAARRAGGDLRLVAPSVPIAAMFTMMHLDSVLVACESAEEAFSVRTARDVRPKNVETGEQTPSA
jgi:anti-anti-sigma factor